MSTLVPATITKTARLYTDLGLFSCRELGADLTDLFNYLTGTHGSGLIAAVGCAGEYARSHARSHPRNCQNGFPGRIVAKMNALVANHRHLVRSLTRRGLT